MRATRPGWPATRMPDAAPAPPGEEVVRGIALIAGEARRFDGRAALTGILADPDARVWVDASSPSHDQVADLSRLLDLHPLIAEDIAERNQRAKFEETDGTIHIVLFWLAWDGQVAETEVDLVLGQRTLLTVHDPAWDPFRLPGLHGDPAAFLRRGVDFLLYAISDGIVDAYFPVLDRIEDEIDAIEDDVIRRPTTETLERLFALKRDLIGLRRATSPAREVFNQLTNRGLAMVPAEHVVYFRDVYDHLIRVTDEVDNDRELVAGTLEVYLSTVNNNLSMIMKRLTGVTVILAGVGALAGIFGMSEAGLAVANGEHGGFYAVTLGIVLLGALTALVLRRIDWI
jgi:magnesium transporter